MHNQFNERVWNGIADGFETVLGVNASGIAISDIISAIDTLRSKCKGFTNALWKEESMAAALFSKNLVSGSSDEVLSPPQTWDGYFELVKASLDKSAAELNVPADIKDTESLERIRRHAVQIEKWYKARDPRLSPVFNWMARYGMGPHLTSLAFGVKHGAMEGDIINFGI